MSTFHQPVLLEKAVDYLVTDTGGNYLDLNLGGGGHSAEILKRLDSTGCLVALDADADAIRVATEKLKGYKNVIIRQAFSDQLDIVLLEENRLPLNGVLFDLGVSSFQVDEQEKGFTFREDGPLDMRFDRRLKKTAADVLAAYPVEEIGRIFREFGEERHWRRIAKAVDDERRKCPIASTGQLAELIKSVIPGRHQAKSLARIFQALRIEVNDELGRLKIALENAFTALDRGGRMVVLAYHSLEDRIVKEFFLQKYRDCVCPPEFPQCVCDKVREVNLITRKPVQPDEAEIQTNPRARSARLRVAEKLVPYMGEV